MNWLRELEEARTVERVLEVVNEYLANRDDEFWTWIPEGARPTLIATRDELYEWHHKLVAEIGKKAAHINLQDLCVLFLRASVRAHQIDLKDDEPSGSSSNDNFSARGRGPRYG